jgi:hypothetical protein
MLLIIEKAVQADNFNMGWGKADKMIWIKNTVLEKEMI